MTKFNIIIFSYLFKKLKGNNNLLSIYQKNDAYFVLTYKNDIFRQSVHVEVVDAFILRVAC